MRHPQTETPTLSASERTRRRAAREQWIRHARQRLTRDRVRTVHEASLDRDNGDR